MFYILTSVPSDFHILSRSFMFMWFPRDDEMPSNSDSTGPVKHCSYAGHLFFFSFEIQNVNTFIWVSGENCVLHNLLFWVEEWRLGNISRVPCVHTIFKVTLWPLDQKVEFISDPLESRLLCDLLWPRGCRGNAVSHHHPPLPRPLPS